MTVSADRVLELCKVLKGFAPRETLSLADYVSSLTEPIAARETAAAAFERSVRRFGIQLTRSQVIAQYDRYNASEHADAATQKVLGRLLDAIEGKTTK